MDNNIANIKLKIKRELADFLGIEMEDVEDESVLNEDLHMNSANLTDFLEILKKAGYTIEGIDLTEVETFLDLFEAITEKE